MLSLGPKYSFQGPSTQSEVKVIPKRRPFNFYEKCPLSESPLLLLITWSVELKLSALKNNEGHIYLGFSVLLAKYHTPRVPVTF